MDGYRLSRTYKKDEYTVNVFIAQEELFCPNTYRSERAKKLSRILLRNVKDI